MRSLGSNVARLVFEHRYGLDTTRHVGREALGFDREEAMPYEPSGWLALSTALRRSEVGPDDVFADLGSGLGRVVFQAALRYRFGRVIGVDLSPELNEVARANVERNHKRLRCPDVEIVTADLLEWEIPADLTIAYLHNSIVGELFDDVMQRLLDFADARERPLQLIYVNPTERGRLLASGRARQLPLPRTLVGTLAGRHPSMIQRFDLLPRADAVDLSPVSRPDPSYFALPVSGELMSRLGVVAETLPY